jgi:GAF domain-containing protein/DNA-binding response OmpR family regulator
MVSRESRRKSTKVKPKILVVDDEPDNLDLLYRSFYREYQVLRAEGGQAALEILAAQQDVAVIISDQRMPGMSGTEFLSRTAHQYPNIIRIILTGYTDVEDLVEAINAGKVFKYVTKPWDDEDLRGVVRQAVDTHNVLKARTEELNRVLRQETLLNAVTNTIRSAQTSQEMLQTIVDTVGPMLEVSACVLLATYEANLSQPYFLYQAAQSGEAPGAGLAVVPEPTLQQTVWPTTALVVAEQVSEDLAAILPPEEDPTARLANYDQAQIVSTLMVPLIHKRELLAVLALHQQGTSRAWQGEEVQLMLTVADQAALALAQASTYERVQALAQREVLLNTITQAIRSSLNPQKIFAAITQKLGQALRVDGCALSLWTEQDEFVQCVGLYDAVSSALTVATAPDSELVSAAGDLVDQVPGLEGEHLPQSQVPISENPVLRRLIETQQPVVIQDLQHMPDMALSDDLPLRSPAQALLVVPLVADGKIIGSISLRQMDGSRHWLPDEVNLAQAVASQAAIAVQQARLYQTTRQQAEQLMVLDRQKTEFFQNVSHEFRTPLTLTIGPLESVVSQGRGLEYDQSVVALRNSRRLLRLVNQLLDLQRLDAGRMQPTFRPCDLATVVAEVMAAFAPYCDRKQITLVQDLSTCPTVYLDLEKFDKILYNLLSNAMKFTAAGGTLTVSLKPAGDKCLLKVEDTGIGIRPDQISSLFERFRQADGSANRSYEGSGLGLALVKELVDLHGGQVSVDSCYGEGTVFSIWLPTGNTHLPPAQVLEMTATLENHRAAIELSDVELEMVPPVADAPPLELDPETAPPDRPRYQVLVVDDNPDLRAYVSNILQRQGYQVRTAHNGAVGVELARTYNPDLIVTDLMMPEVNGLDLIRQIRAEREMAGIPIVLLTAKVDEETRIESAERGADAYLSKPFNDRELLAEVRNLLSLKANERRVAELNKYLTESVLKRFLPPSLVEKAAQGDLQLDLSPEPRLVTILFTDIIGFTPLSNMLQSQRVAELLNEYLESMTEAIFQNGGTVDKFMGDAVLALFGAPEELEPAEQVQRAVAAARQMYSNLDKLNQQWQAKGISPVQFRCGIHHGMAVVGMFGGAGRADYTAIGPSVNIAARLQEAAAADCILVSASVAEYLGDQDLVQSTNLQLKALTSR